MDNLSKQLDAVLNKLCKWRMVFAGWQLGTRAKGDSESDALRDHREATMMLRVEVSALTRLMLEKKVITQAELSAAVLAEAEHLDDMYAKRFPGFTSADFGMSMEPVQAKETMKGWRP